MKTTRITVLNSEELASNLGKKGTSSDITLYNHKKGEMSLTVSVPTRFPEKLPPLIYSLYLGDMVFMIVEKLDRVIGEELVACDVMEKNRGKIILKNYIQKEQVIPLIKGTYMEGWELVDELENPNELRETLMEMTSPPITGATRVTVDHSFPVKGVGTVVLGVVDRGVVSRHQKLTIYPSEKEVQIRSIQVHDNDVDEASSGSRVGLALRNTPVEDVPRGSILAEKDSVEAFSELVLDVTVNRFWRDTLEEGMVIHLAHGMQFIPATVSGGGPVKAGGSSGISLVLDAPLVLSPEDRPILVWLESSGPRVIGRGIRVR